MSSPQVAGLAALVLGMDPSLTPAEVRQIIRDGAIDMGSVGFDRAYGYGRIDVLNTLALVGPQCSVPADCDDSDPCTIDDCVGGACSNTPMDCDDSSACTTDYCSGGVCYNDPITCDDGISARPTPATPVRGACTRRSLACRVRYAWTVPANRWCATTTAPVRPVRTAITAPATVSRVPERCAATVCARLPTARIVNRARQTATASWAVSPVVVTAAAAADRTVSPAQTHAARAMETRVRPSRPYRRAAATTFARGRRTSATVRWIVAARFPRTATIPTSARSMTAWMASVRTRPWPTTRRAAAASAVVGLVPPRPAPWTSIVMTASPARRIPATTGIPVRRIATVAGRLAAWTMVVAVRHVIPATRIAIAVCPPVETARRMRTAVRTAAIRPRTTVVDVERPRKG